MKKSECCPTRFFNGCRTRHSSLAVSFKKVSAECPLPKYRAKGDFKTKAEIADGKPNERD